MKIAIVYNRESREVINLFGLPNREKYGLKNIRRIVDSLKEGKHNVIALEGDKNLIDHLEEFMPRVLKGERPGMVFNLSYGIQGQARYTHVPGMLEMVGIPYVGSGPLAHSLALDKVVTKMIMRQHDLPTPDFAVLYDRDFPAPDLSYPLIVKPKNEAVSFGLRIVNNEEELREGAAVIFEQFHQPVLVEQFIEGREINVGLLGNNPPEAFPPAELLFGEGGPPIYTYEDKTHRSGREIRVVCPAEISEELTAKAQTLAQKAFSVLGCYDCARVDMRLDPEGNLYILEVNSLPSLGQHGSYTAAAEKAGLDFSGLVNRLVDVATARYFGTPAPPKVDRKHEDPSEQVFSYLTERRDRIERRLQEWTGISSPTADPVGVRTAVKELDRSLRELRLRPRPDRTDDRAVWTWETSRGYEGGTLFIGNLDVPLEQGNAVHAFRRDPEWLYGEGIGSSRAPLVMLEYALRALRRARLLDRLRLGILYVTDEGRECRYSADGIKEAARKAARVFVLRPGSTEGRVITQRRGQRKYRLTIEGKALRPGQSWKKPAALRWAFTHLDRVASLSTRSKKLSISTTDLRTDSFPGLIPHRVNASLLMSYLDPALADETERKMREGTDDHGLRWSLDQISDRPPLKERKRNLALAHTLGETAQKWEIPFGTESSLWPSVAGLIPEPVPVVCGLGPAVSNLYTPHECVQRISLVQRTLLLAEYLLTQAKE